MVSYTGTLARPEYLSAKKASSSVPALPRQTLNLAAIGASPNFESLQRSLAGAVPRIEFSPGTQMIRQRRASVPRSIDIGRVQPQQLGTPANLEAFGKQIGTASVFQPGGALEFVGALQDFGNNFRTGVRGFFGIKDTKKQNT